MMLLTNFSRSVNVCCSGSEVLTEFNIVQYCRLERLWSRAVYEMHFGGALSKSH